MILKCTVCRKLIEYKYPWNPEVKESNEVSFHQFKESDVVMCEDCHKRYQKLFKLHIVRLNKYDK